MLMKRINDPRRGARYVMAWEVETVPEVAGYGRASGIFGSDEDSAMTPYLTKVNLETKLPTSLTGN